MNEHFAFIGLGQVGGMLALRTRAAWPDAPIVVCDDSDGTHGEFGPVVAANEWRRAVEGATFIVLAVPINAAVALLPALLSRADQHAVVLDASSVAAPGHAAARGDSRFIGAHPMCGNEGRGFAAAEPEALIGAAFVLTQTQATGPQTVHRAHAFAAGLGARVVERTPEAHDVELAAVSHSPQLIASLLAQAAPREALALAGSGFRDTTRLAQSPAELWVEIARHNAGPIARFVRDFARRLHAVADQLDVGESLHVVFAQGAAAHAALPKGPAKTLASRVNESATAVVSARVSARARSGRESFGFNVGEPHLPLSPALEALVHESMAKAPIAYTEVGGAPELRERIAQQAKAVTGHVYGSGDVLATSGAKQALHLALGSVVGPGDEVIVFQPAWVSFSEIVRYAGAKAVPHEVGALPLPLSARTRAVVLNTPNNPTGAAYDREWLRAMLASLPANSWVISDEIYRTFDPEHDSPLRQVARDRAIFIDGISKSHGMTGLRIGFVAAPAEVAGQMRRLASQETSCASSVSQAVAMALLDHYPAGDAELQRQVRERGARVRHWVDALQGTLELHDLWPIARPASFYAWLDVRRFGETSRQLCADLLESTGVALMPGEAFGAPGFARLCYAVSSAELEPGLTRLGDFLRSAT